MEIEGGHLRILPTTDNKFFNGNTHEKPSPFLVFGLHLAGKGMKIELWEEYFYMMNKSLIVGSDHVV